MSKNPKLPKGWKVWKKISVLPIGSFSLIAKKDNEVGIFEFDGESDEPIRVFVYKIIK